MGEIRPFHRVICEKLAILASNIQALDRDIKQGGVAISGGRRFLSVDELSFGRNQEIGGFCTLLDILPEMEMPPDALAETIAELKKLTYRHAILWNVIEELEHRAKTMPTS